MTLAFKFAGDRRLSFFLLSITVFSMPLFEALKNICLVLFVINCAIGLLRSRQRKTTRRELMLPFLLFGLSAIFSGFLSNSWLSLSAINWLLYPLVGYLIAALGLPDSDKRFLLICALMGAVVAIFETSFWNFDGSGELRSVGYRTHSAIYLLLMSTIAVFFLGHRSSAIIEKLLALIFLFSAAIFIWVGGTAIGMMGISVVAILSSVYFYVLKKKFGLSQIFIWVMCLLAVDAYLSGRILGIGGGSLTDFQIAAEQEFQKTKAMLDVATSVEGLQQSLFGFGISEFSVAVADFDWTEIAGSQGVNSALLEKLKMMNHGHSTFNTVLAERGLVGSVLFWSGATVYLFYFCNGAYTNASNKIEAAEIFAGGAYAITILLVIGLIQTTFHLEHGLLGFILMGLWYGDGDDRVGSRGSLESRSEVKLKIFTFGNERVPSTRFRVMQYLDQLSEHFDCRCSSDKPRINDLIAQPNEIIFIQKRLISASTLLFARLFNRGKWVYDFDDAIWESAEETWSSFTRQRVRIRFKIMMACVDQVFVSSTYLARRVPPAKARLIPVSVESKVLTADKSACSTQPLVLGWSGKPSSAYQIREFVERVPKRIFEQVRLLVLSGHDPELNIQYSFMPFSPANEDAFYRLVDVGIVPSTARLFDLGKTPVKALQHFSYGKTVISNPRGAGAEFITDDTAVIVNEDDWEAALHSVIADRVNLKKLSSNALRTQRLRYSRELTVGRLIESLHALSGS